MGVVGVLWLVRPYIHPNLRRRGTYRRHSVATWSSVSSSCPFVGRLLVRSYHNFKPNPERCQQETVGCTNTVLCVILQSMCRPLAGAPLPDLEPNPQRAHRRH